MARMTIEKLAVIVHNGFLSLEEKIDKKLSPITEDIRIIKMDVEDIKLRLDQKANKIDLDILEKEFQDHARNHK